MHAKRTIRRLVAVLGLALAASGAASGQPAYRIHVDGLACPFCAYGIEKKLAALDGVERLETDIASGTVTLTMAEGAKLDEASARRAVHDAGFSLRRFEAFEGAAPDMDKGPRQ